MSHTSGPWEWFYDGGGTYSIGKEPDAQSNPPHVTIWDRNHARATANAHLIVAAPELLEAAHSVCQAFSLTRESDEAECAAINAAYDKCRAAIAKAEGR